MKSFETNLFLIRSIAENSLKMTMPSKTELWRVSKIIIYSSIQPKYSRVKYKRIGCEYDMRES